MPNSKTYTTLEAAALIGVAVRSVQQMVDRGELQAWKTAGGHRRILQESVHSWLESRRSGGPTVTATGPVATSLSTPQATARPAPMTAESRHLADEATQRRRPRVLLIEDSNHFQNLVRLLVAQKFPDVELHVAEEGIAGLAMAGQLQPDVLLVDILLPGIDGATLITSLRTHPQFQRSRLLVVTSLDPEDRAPYEFALTGVPVVHKPQLVMALPPLLAEALAQAQAENTAALAV